MAKAVLLKPVSISKNIQPLPRREEVRRLLILRPDHLGDLVLFSGALKFFRRHWPEAHISLCVWSFGRELFAHCPEVNALIPYEKLHDDLLGQGRLPWMPPVRGCDRLGGLLRNARRGFARRAYETDLALLPVLAPWREYSELIRLIPARHRIGILGNCSNQTTQDEETVRGYYSAQMDASALPWNFPEMEATRRFLNFLGIEAGANEVWPDFWTTDNDRQVAFSLMPQKAGKMILGLAPGVSSVTGKRLPPEWYVRVFESLNWKDVHVVLFGSKADIAECDALARTLQKHGSAIPVLNLAAKTSVREMIECLRCCDMVLSQETAALHIATALRKPVAGIVGGGHFGRFYPWSDPKSSLVLNRPMDCYGCNWRCKYDTIRCIQEIPVSEAARALQQLRPLVG